MESTKIVKAVLIGTAIGAAIGIFLAPAKGCETRKKIAEKGEDFINAIKDNFSSFINEISDTYTQIKEKFTDAVSSNKN